MRLRKVAGAPVDFGALRVEFQVPGDFSVAELNEAARSAVGPELALADATDVPFVTLDPAGSRDLDQAMHLSRTASGYLVQYAIADVAAFVAPESALDAASMRRGETFYFPDLRMPLYPPSLSEGAASLLAGQICPAVVWRIQLDDEGAPTAVEVGRARVRSQAQLDYETVERSDPNELPDAIRMLSEIGQLLLRRTRARHAIDLDLPEQQVVTGPQGLTLAVRRPLASEVYNAQLSELTGMVAAELMIGAQVGILRTVIEPDAGAVDALRHVARALKVDWPLGVPPGDVLAGLDRTRSTHLALIEHAASLLRGAGYVAFDGSVPPMHTHAGIGAAYAHVTAPLRRLADRFATEVCLAVHERRPVPPWVLARLDQLPQTMYRADQQAHAVEHAVIDMTEAWLLRDRVGQSFGATVIDAQRHGATVVIDDPPIRARCSGMHMRAGAHLAVRLVTADVATRSVHFERAQPRNETDLPIAAPDARDR